MIRVNYEELEASIARLHDLKKGSISLSDPVVESVGNAAQEEKEILRLLQELCSADIPALIDSSINLLNAILKEFRAKEALISKAMDTIKK